MDQLPIFMNLHDKPCLVVGGGAVAARKADLMRAAGARVTVVAPMITGETRRMVDDGRLSWREDVFEEPMVAGNRLVIAATDEPAVNRAVYAACERRGIPVNVADEPELCSFILPGIVNRSPVTIALSTGGRSPVLARLMRARLETLIPSGFGRLADLLGRYRQAAKDRIHGLETRKRFWENVIDGPIGNLVLSGKDREAEDKLAGLLADQDAPTDSGEVYLIGAGPGDPDLLTFRALRLLQKADVVVYDRLVAPAIVDLARREAERIYVGKRAGHHSCSQEDISSLLRDLAAEGKRVARLKGGDPFIFGRGGEEIEVLAEAGLPFQVVPGITAASGCAAYAGIPLTHRDHAQSVRFVTGHRRGDGLDLDWRNLAEGRDTLVFYMGLGSARQICDQLIAHGMPRHRKAALIERGTTDNQRVYTGTLASLPNKITAAESPSLLVIGEVTGLHDSLGWFQGRGAATALFPDSEPCLAEGAA
ncbi:MULTISPECIES: siroheme synthase CysG [unclassified Guyparkeria]|uniref:siroheme synthase CysG n=1 Tax=unclassified Guyparkeria TaxID=2626246 RepID=UPI0007333AEA|nr:MULTISPECIES: siroheme synthase CysG [unclassified Guyparkeria]KTG16190.1 sirohydrochlorin ferrochelatase [Guyparkeria sp. XI15]OAE85041.1 sirohydrochlorin ferrochelatase [Guyparkeria sp. WRN-7]